MKISLYIATSLDGFIARENGDLDWLPGSDGQSDGEDYGYQQLMASVDTLIMGRNTYEMVLSFGAWSYGEKRVIVLSSRELEIPAHLADTVQARSSSPAELADELHETGAQHIYIDGGKTIQGFLQADLVDEMIITRIPVLLGSGIPLFGVLDHDRKLRHLQTSSFPNGFVQSKYEILK